MFGAFQKTILELLSRRDWIYLLSLLVPLAVYNLTLKTMSIAIKDDGAGFFWGSLGLMRSDLLFNVGYGILWIGIFAVARRGILRKVAVVLFHFISLFIVTVTTVAYQYFEGTGSTLDYSVIAFYLGTLGEVKDIIASEAAWYVWLGLILALLYGVFGPWAITSFLMRQSSGGIARASRLGAVGLCLIAVGIASLSLLPGTEDSDRAFSLSPLTNVLITGISAQSAGELTVEEASNATAPLTDANLEETPRTEKRNVVLIHLESTRERSSTPYNPDIRTMPFLDELSKKSLLIERAYTTTPHTSKALTSINCGIYPDPTTDIHEAEPGGVPVKCLPGLLEEQGYDTVMFQSATETFENRPQLAENFGYEEFVGLKEMSKKGFERAGYLGYEDDILLEPSRDWLTSHQDKPFMASYIGITPHHEYLAPTRYGRKNFDEDDVMNRYLNAVRYDDFWVRNIIDQYKKLGLYENTIFVIYGDHGEAFGEHGVKGHDGVVYEEGLRVPLIIHDPKRWQGGERIGADAPVNHMDIPPTIVDLLGYEVTNGEYPGVSALEAPEDRTLYFNCRPDLQCMASIRGYRKYVYYYGKQPEEFYDLENDPLENNDIAAEIPPSEIEQRRNDLLEWRSHAAATFEETPPKSE